MSDAEVRAAGGVVWRRAAGRGIDVLVVHRPKYGDWTFPKGKVKEGESDEACALREVEEESGLSCDLGVELATASYRDGERRSKAVRYWAMQPVAGRFEPHAEVDDVRWLPPAEAAATLTYGSDRTVLESFLAVAGNAGPLHARPLREGDLGPDPLRAFAAWYADAAAKGVRMPESVALATATSAGAPSARMVLLKGFDERGFVFFTGFGSRKGRELAANPQAALLFYWEPLGRQVRIEGPVTRVSRGESAEYFATRPRGSQLSASVSRQSEVVASRQALETRVEELAAEYDGREVPPPEHWGGYRLEPEEYEFWQHRDDRLHDRLRYRRAADRWVVERLQP